MSRPFADPALARRLVDAIRRQVESGPGPVTLMEVCGTHTVAISRSGIRELLAGYVDLRSGPGCPVCVTDQADIDQMVGLAFVPGVSLLTYGDMVRVPGSRGTLEGARAAGADVRVVYSAGEALRIAREEPARRFVFLAVGFETTAPGTALALREAASLGCRNFLVYSGHKTLPEALRALLGPGGAARGQAGPNLPGDPAPAGGQPTPAGGQPTPAPEPARVQGFILPGHVSAVIGRRAYVFLPAAYGLPAAVTGFEAVDILAAVAWLVRALSRGEAGVANLYPRVVREEGNPRALELINQVFAPAPAAWRGLGTIPGSGLALRGPYRAFDAGPLLPAGPPGVGAAGSSEAPAAALKACRCGNVLRGEILPPECPLFGRVCTPADPVGPCMVSSEGSCAAYYRYGTRRWTA